MSDTHQQGSGSSPDPTPRTFAVGDPVVIDAPYSQYDGMVGRVEAVGRTRRSSRRPQGVPVPTRFAVRIADGALWFSGTELLEGAQP